MTAASLTVSIVLFHPREDELLITCRSLAAALAQAREIGTLGECVVWLVDNTPEAQASRAVREAARDVLQAAKLDTAVRAGQGNLGYGRGHNLALLATASDYHLVLNPDVRLAPDALVAALRFMQAHSEVGLLSPQVRNEAGERLYLCKRYPSMLDFLLRGFAPGCIRRAFARRLARYEMRESIGDAVVMPVPIVSGCFMFLRRSAIALSGGFDPAFFLYFEDFDLSWRLAQSGTNAYVPSVNIVHFGGHAARKGWHHVRLFVAAGRIFFGKHGWKLC